MSNLAMIMISRRGLVSAGVLGLLLGTNFALWAAIYISGSWLLGSISSLVLAAVP